MEHSRVIVSGFIVCLRKSFGALALMGFLVSGVLPLGQIPRVTGPCGRVLCECPMVTVCCHGSSGEIIERQEPHAVWTLNSIQTSKTIDTTLFVVVVSDFNAASSVPVQTASCDAIAVIPAQALAVPFAIPFDIPTPPPRQS